MVRKKFIRVRRPAFYDEHATGERSRVPRRRVVSGTAPNRSVCFQCSETDADEKTLKRDVRSLLWCDAFRPCRVEELVIAPRKRVEIESWLSSCFEASADRLEHKFARPPQVGILWGPSGAGASTAIELLAKERFHATVVSWSTVDRCFDAETGYATVMESFFQFLIALSYAPSLQPASAISSPSSIETTAARSSESTERLAKRGHETGSTRWLAIVEDFPVGANEHEEWADRSLQTYLLELLYQLAMPLVWIMPSDPQWRARQLRFLFGMQAKIPNQLPPWVRAIELRPATENRIQKVLLQISQELVVASIESDDAKASSVKRLARELARRSSGDVRQAIQMMQFCLMGQSTVSQDAAHWGRKRTRISVGPTFWGALLPHLEENPSIGFCHSIARILYDKHQEEEWRSTDERQSPASRVTLPTTASACAFFLAALHENFLDHFVSIEDATDALADFSIADLMQRDGRDASAEIAVQVAVCGVRCANRCHAPAAYRPVRLPTNRSLSCSAGRFTARERRRMSDRCEGIPSAQLARRDTCSMERERWMASSLGQPSDTFAWGLEQDALPHDRIQDDDEDSTSGATKEASMGEACRIPSSRASDSNAASTCLDSSRSRRQRLAVRIVGENVSASKHCQIIEQNPLQRETLGSLARSSSNESCFVGSSSEIVQNLRGTERRTTSNTLRDIAKPQWKVFTWTAGRRLVCSTRLDIHGVSLGYRASRRYVARTFGCI
ncbi:hypothetical protein F1559_002066 [Cyanidiococcus yangmingshanensis]|uniref:Cell cycle checkpoint protein rad17 n=1 Tax=Cyanidiococcus yangmingshanensis TaxID=2690220 RepID=A0A7J7IF38_9RHOD|nr:hypothetical protein F1559_002066 [Cyanidiococcus yangmingshanensis]